MKRCGDCGEVKADSDYHSNVRCPGGLSFYCKPCAAIRSEQSRQRRGIKPRKRAPEAIASGLKWCPDCEAVKSLEDFPRSQNIGVGRAPYCKPCHNARGKESRERHGGHRNYHLRRRYGITAAHVDGMLASQAGLCAICRLTPAVHVDHDHVTGKVRGLLCFNCNGGLGQFKDRIDVLEAAVKYLQFHGLTEAPSAAASPTHAPYRWPRVIELFPYRGGEIDVERWQHLIGA